MNKKSSSSFLPSSFYCQLKPQPTEHIKLQDQYPSSPIPCHFPLPLSKLLLSTHRLYPPNKMQFRSLITAVLLAVPAVFGAPFEADLDSRTLNADCLKGLCPASVAIMQKLNAGAYKSCIDMCASFTGGAKTKCKACCDEYKKDGRDWKAQLKIAKENKACK